MVQTYLKIILTLKVVSLHYMTPNPKPFNVHNISSIYFLYYIQ